MSIPRGPESGRSRTLRFDCAGGSPVTQGKGIGRWHGRHSQGPFRTQPRPQSPRTRGGRPAARFVREAGVAAFGLDGARTVRGAGARRRGAEDRRGRRGPRRADAAPTRCVRPATRRRAPRGLGPGRRPLLDTSRSLRRRSDRRARRRVHRHRAMTQIRRLAHGARPQARQPARGRAERHRRPRLLRRRPRGGCDEHECAHRKCDLSRRRVCGDLVRRKEG